MGSKDAVEQLMDVALNDPVVAVSEAEQWIAAEAPLDRIHGLRARGLARRQLGEFDRSEQDLDLALALADDAQERDLWAAVGLTLAGTWVHLGKVDEAKTLLVECIESTHGRTHAQAIYQLGTTFAQVGDLDEALRHYQVALPLIRDLGEVGWEANLLGNRGTMNIYRGDYDAAIDDLARAMELVRASTDGPSQLALYMNNTAYALHLRGDVTESIDLYAETEAFQEEHGLPATMFAHRCNAYLAAGMYEETMRLAREAHAFHRRGQAAVGGIEALLAGADAALALGEPDQAAALAQQALDLDQECSFPVWNARARLVKLEAEGPSSWVQGEVLDQCEELFAAADGNDSSVAARALLWAAGAAIGQGDVEAAGGLLDRAEAVVANAPRHLSIEWHRLIAQFAEVRGDTAGLLASVEAGLERYRQVARAAPSFDVAHKAARHAAGLVERVVPVLIETGDVRRAVELVEVARASALPEPPPASQASGSSITFVELGDDLVALWLDGDTQVSWRCGSVRDVGELVESQTYARRQLARAQRLSNAAQRELLAHASAADAALDHALVRVALGARVVVNPSPVLAPTVWAGLQSFNERAFVVAPSRALGFAKIGDLGSALAVGCSALRHVPEELQSIAGTWDAASELDPARSVLDAFEQVDVLHLASHFVNDMENPLLSGLDLGGFELRGHEYGQLGAPPRVVALSACSSGVTTEVGTASAGFVMAALAAGTRSVLATTTPVEDGAALVGAMRSFHEELRRGADPATALHQVRRAATPADRSTVDSLVVFGAGWL